MVTGREGSICGLVADRNKGYRRAVLSKQGLCEQVKAQRSPLSEEEKQAWGWDGGV